MGVRVLEELVQDIRWAVRTLWKRPLYVVTATVTLGLGIGANTAIFSVVNGMLFQPLPVRDPGSLVVVGQINRNIPVPLAYFAFPDYREIREQHSVFSDAIAYSPELVGFRIGSGAEVEPRFMQVVSGNYFSELGLRPALGRLLTEDDDRGRVPAIVLGWAVWQSRFAGDPAVLGRRVMLDGIPFTVVGVTPQPFLGTEQVIEMDGYISFGADELLAPSRRGRSERRDELSMQVHVLARLRAGVNLTAARAAMEVLARRIEREYPDAARGTKMVVVPETRSRPTLSVASVIPWAAGVFMALVSLVLIIACVNVANLTLVRAATRQGEMALRHALGASRSRVLRQLLTESVIVAVLGLVLGAVLALWALHWLGALKLATDLPIRFGVAPDWRVFVYSVVIAVLAGIATGISPALRGARTNAGEVLKESGRGAIGTRGKAGGVLVIAQVAVSLVLVVCAGLFIRSVRASAGIDLGFRRDHLLMAQTDASLQRYDSVKIRQLVHRLELDAAAIPGVRAVAVVGTVPFGFGQDGGEVYPDVEVPGLTNGHMASLWNKVSSGFFDVMGVQILDGRGFTRTDSAGAPLVTVVTRTMAERFWPGRSAIGHHLRFAAGGPPVEVVGVAHDARYIFVNEKLQGYLYVPFSQSPRAQLNLLLRTTGDPAAVAPAARRLFHDIDPDLPVFDVKTMETHLQFGQAYFFMRLAAMLATAVGLIGLVQTLVGLYGVIAYGVAQRTRELGIRMALGASPLDVMGRVMRRGVVLAAIGVASGVMVALGVTQLMSGLLVGVNARDAVTFVGAATMLVVLTLVSTFIPAWRAARLAPLSALRDD